MNSNQIARPSFMRRSLRSLILGASLVLALAGEASAQSTFVVTISQVGNDVVATGSGTILTDSLTYSFSAPAGPSINPSGGDILIGSGGNADIYLGASSVTFGSGLTALATSGSGDVVAFGSSVHLIGVPSGYVSGAPLSATTTWAGTTIADLGITPGTYISTWGSGSTGGSFTVTTSSVPEPTPTFALFLVGGVALAFGWRSRRQSVL